MSHREKNWLVGRSNGRGRTEALQFAKKLETKVIWEDCQCKFLC